RRMLPSFFMILTVWSVSLPIRSASILCSRSWSASSAMPSITRLVMVRWWTGRICSGAGHPGERKSELDSDGVRVRSGLARQDQAVGDVLRVEDVRVAPVHLALQHGGRARSAVPFPTGVRRVQT